MNFGVRGYKPTIHIENSILNLEHMVVIMNNILTQWLELNNYIDENIDILSIKEKENLINELEKLTQEIINQ